MEYIKPDTHLHQVLTWIQDVGASDLHLQEGKPARYRIEGRLKTISTEQLPALSRQQIFALLGENFSPKSSERIEQKFEKRPIFRTFQVGSEKIVPVTRRGYHVQG